MVPLLVLIVFLGVYPKPVLDRIEPSVERARRPRRARRSPTSTIASPRTASGSSRSPTSAERRARHRGEPRDRRAAPTRADAGRRAARRPARADRRADARSPRRRSTGAALLPVARSCSVGGTAAAHRRVAARSGRRPRGLRAVHRGRRRRRGRRVAAAVGPGPGLDELRGSTCRRAAARSRRWPARSASTASALFVTVVICAAVILGALLADGYLRREGLDGPEFYVLMLLSASGGVIMAMANDLIVLFLGLEILSIAVYVLAAMHLRRITVPGGRPQVLRARRASRRRSSSTASRSIYGATGIHQPRRRSTSFLADDRPRSSNGLLLAGMALLLVGFGFKVAAVPFHSWSPDVYDGAPTPVVAFMASGVKAAAFAGLLRVFVLTFSNYAADWQPIVYALAVLTMVVGSVLAVVQTNVKRMLAYSSISHAGFILVAVEAGQRRRAPRRCSSTWPPTRSWSPARFGVVSRSSAARATARIDLDDYRGLSRVEPGAGAARSRCSCWPRPACRSPSASSPSSSVIGAAVDAEHLLAGRRRHGHRRRSPPSSTCGHRRHVHAAAPTATTSEPATPRRAGRHRSAPASPSAICRARHHRRRASSPRPWSTWPSTATPAPAVEPPAADAAARPGTGDPSHRPSRRASTDRCPRACAAAAARRAPSDFVTSPAASLGSANDVRTQISCASTSPSPSWAASRWR